MDLRIALTTYYDGQRPWQNNINDLVDYRRAFEAGDGETKRIAQAMLSQNPAMPRSEIKQNMTTHRFPSRFGYNDTQLTINDVLADRLNTDENIHVDEWNNFSGSNGETNSSPRNSNTFW